MSSWVGKSESELQKEAHATWSLERKLISTQVVDSDRENLAEKERKNGEKGRCVEVEKRVLKLLKLAR